MKAFQKLFLLLILVAVFGQTALPPVAPTWSPDEESLTMRQQSDLVLGHTQRGAEQAPTPIGEYGREETGPDAPLFQSGGPRQEAGLHDSIDIGDDICQQLALHRAARETPPGEGVPPPFSDALEFY